MTKKKNDLKQTALNMKIPIISDEGLLFLLDLIKKNNVKKVLEIGTGIGYSAIMFADLVCDIKTVEKDPFFANVARKKIVEFNLESKITVVEQDALDASFTELFDLIFIDAAKAQYEKFFCLFKDNLALNGMIVTDNLNFHHLDINKVNKNTKNLIKKLQRFKTFLINNTEFVTTFTDLGDGMSVSRRVVP